MQTNRYLIKTWLLIVLLAMTIPVFSSVPGPVTTAGTNSICSGNSFTIPVTVTNFNNVGIISLKLNYDPLLVQFQSVVINPSLSTLFPVYGSSSGQFTLSAFGSTGVSLADNSVLFTLTLLAKPGVSGTCPFTWNASPGNCEYAPPAPGDPYITIPFGDYFINGSCVVNASPVPVITGSQNVCINSAGNVYSTQSGMTNYTWSISSGGTITSGGTSTSSTATVTWNTMGAQWIKVNYTNTNGCTGSSPTQYNLTVHPLPVPTISGPAVTCALPAGSVYTTQGSMTNYLWSVSAGGTILSGGTTADNTITIRWNNPGNQTVSVNYTNSNGCTAVSPVILPVSVASLPVPTISGPGTACPDGSGHLYVTESGMNNYSWTVSSGGVILSGGGVNDFTVTVGWTAAGAQSVSVGYTSSGCASANPTNYGVTVDPVPSPAGPVTGTPEICAGTTGVVYSIEPVANTTTYIWSVPAGATIASGAGTNVITVNFAANASSGNIRAYGSNLCGNGSPSPDYPVVLTLLPSAAGAITGKNSVCLGETGVTYSVAPVTNATGYVWSLPAGASIAGGMNTNSILVDFSFTASPGTISVYGSSACGNGSVSPSFSVTTTAVPGAPLISAVNTTTLSSNVPAGNQWFRDGIELPGETGQTISPVVDGIYWDRIRENDCLSDTSNHITWPLVGVREINSANFQIYPVPNQGLFFIRLTGIENAIYSLEVNNSLGEVIFHREIILFSGISETAVDLEKVPGGVYTVALTSENSRAVRKIVVNR